MNEYFVDLHIHIGRTNSGRPVKITGSKLLTIENILHEASYNKGMNMIGVIDCHVPEVLLSLERMVQSNKVIPLEEGGLQFKEVTLVLGTEIELNEDRSNGPYHVLCYLPTLEIMKVFSNWLSSRMKNISLSTQRLYDSGENLQKKVKELGGLFIPAHVFTPFKSLYGAGVKSSLIEVLDPELIDGIELGLSSNTEMADQISELHRYPFLSNSDAHSVQKIAREYQIMKMKSPTFMELKKALAQTDGRGIHVNYGLDPKLGKYHRTTCEKCFTLMEDEKTCPNCSHPKLTKGVYERLNELKDVELGIGKRPPYIHQVPLEFIPGLGPKTLEKLKDNFKTEMNILHHIPMEDLIRVAGETIGRKIIQGRKGELMLESGGGGKYGRVGSR